MARDDEQTNIRLPIQMKRGLESTADVNRRSFTAEVVARLQKSMEGEGENSITIPDSILKRLKEEAQANGWPLESEVLHRLVDSFAEKPTDQDLRVMLEDERQRSAKLRQELVELVAKDVSGSKVLYILLDAHGYPIAWNEIHAYFDALKEASGSLPTEWHSTIITPDLESSSHRVWQAARLASRLRAIGKSAVVGGEELQPGPEDVDFVQRDDGMLLVYGDFDYVAGRLQSHEIPFVPVQGGGLLLRTEDAKKAVELFQDQPGKAVPRKPIAPAGVAKPAARKSPGLADLQPKVQTGAVRGEAGKGKSLGLADVLPRAAKPAKPDPSQITLANARKTGPKK